MSKLLIALLALDIGVNLSKVFIFTWKSINLAKRNNYFQKNKYLVGILYLMYLFFKKIN